MALIGGPIQILLTCSLAAAAAAPALGMPAREAIWFGAMISVSSTAVVLKILSAGGVTHTLASSVMIGLLVVQDLAVVPMLVSLPQLGAPGSLLARLGSAIGSPLSSSAPSSSWAPGCSPNSSASSSPGARASCSWSPSSPSASG